MISIGFGDLLLWVVYCMIVENGGSIIIKYILY